MLPVPNALRPIFPAALAKLTDAGVCFNDNPVFLTLLTYMLTMKYERDNIL